MTSTSGFRAMLAAGATAMALSGCVAMPIGTFEDASVSTGPVQVRRDLYFQNASPFLLPGEAQQVNSVLRELKLRPQDEVIVTFGATGSDVLDAQRSATLRGIIASSPARLSVVGPLGIAPTPDRPDIALLQVRLSNRILVTCPANGVPVDEEPLNPQIPEFGCANPVNVTVMAAQKSDLTTPRQLKGSDAIPSVAAVERYRAGEVIFAPLGSTTN